MQTGQKMDFERNFKDELFNEYSSNFLSKGAKRSVMNGATTFIWNILRDLCIWRIFARASACQIPLRSFLPDVLLSHYSSQLLLTPLDCFWLLLTPFDSFWLFLTPFDSFGLLWNLFGSFWLLLTPFFFGLLWTPLDFFGLLWTPLDSLVLVCTRLYSFWFFLTPFCPNFNIVGTQSIFGIDVGWKYNTGWLLWEWN